jgi:hypothetical protein
MAVRLVMYLSIFLRAGALFTIALLRNRSLLRGILSQIYT